MTIPIIPYDEYEKLALVLFTDKMTADQRLAFATFIGYDPNDPSFVLKHVRRSQTRNNGHVECTIRAFLRGRMKKDQTVFMMLLLGFDPFEGPGAWNTERIKTLYRQVDFSMMIDEIAREFEAAHPDL